MNGRSFIVAAFEVLVSWLCKHQTWRRTTSTPLAEATMARGLGGETAQAGFGVPGR